MDTGHGRDNLCSGSNLPDAVVVGIGDIEISGFIKRDSSRLENLGGCSHCIVAIKTGSPCSCNSANVLSI